MQQNRDWEGNTRGHSSSHLESGGGGSGGMDTGGKGRC